MARMLLYLDKPRQPESESNITEVFPIYELDYNAAIEAGVDITIDWDTKCTNSVNDCYAITLSSTDVNLSRYFSTNAPHQAWQDGSILKGRMSPYVQDEETGIYDLDSAYYDFEPIPIGTRPDDWGVASNIVSYFMPPAFTYNNVQYRYKLWYNNRKDYTWDSSKQYYYDKNRAIIKQFYTENGYSFGCYCGGNDYSSSGNTNSPYCCLIGYSQGTDGMDNLSAMRYTFTNPAGTVLSYTNGRAGLAMNCSSVSTSSNEDKANCLLGNDIRRSWTQVFFHMVYRDRDYYGVLGLRCGAFSEDAPYASFYGCAFTSEFWGNSIIAGGGGEGVWGDVSTTGGGNGTFDFDTTENRLNNLPHIKTQALNLMMLDVLGTHYNIWSLSGSDLQAILNVTFSHDFIDLYNNSTFNPMSGVVNLALLPLAFVEESSDTAPMTISGFNISDVLSDMEFHSASPITHLGFDAVGIDAVYDAFPDFTPYTTAVLHLPYIGDIEIDMNYIVGGTIQVTYLCDVLSGNVTAWVLTTDREGHNTYHYNASGNCAYNIPILSTFFDGSSVSKLRDSFAYTASNAFMSELPYFAPLQMMHRSGALRGALGLASDIRGVMTAPRGSVIRGSFGGNSSLLADTLCYLEITRPAWVEPANYRQLNGIPSELSGTLYDDGSDIHTMYDGFTLVSEIHLENVDCTDNEKGMIEAVLKRGVHIHSDRY